MPEKTVTEHIREHLYSQFFTVGRKNIPDLDSLKQSEWSSEFENFLNKIKTFQSPVSIQLMKNRLIMGAIRYGLIKDSNKNLNYIKGFKTKIFLYNKNKNTENLIDAGNYFLLEFGEREGFFNHKTLRKRNPVKNNIQEVVKWSNKYEKTKDKKCLLYACNYCLHEFEVSDGCFIAGDDTVHCEVKK